MTPILAFIVIFLLVVLLLAARDGANAATPGYDSAIGYDKPRGWFVMFVLIGLALVACGLSGIGPLAVALSK